jgi:uncharacterized protein
VKRVFRTTLGQTLEVELADGFWSRAKGLLGRSSLAPNDGLMITPCSSVHTVGMRFAIDVVFLDRAGQVKSIVRGLKPYRTAACRNAVRVLELAEGGCERHGVSVGDYINLV